MTTESLPLNTLLAAIVDALATAVAAKIPAAPLPDTEALNTIIDTRILEAATKLVDERIGTHETLTDIVVSIVENNGHITDLITDTVTGALDDNRALDRKIDDAIDSAIDNIDWPDRVTDALDNIDLTDYGALSESDVDDRIDAKLEQIDLTDAAADAVSKALGEVALLTEPDVRRIVREELRAMLAGATAAIPE